MMSGFAMRQAEATFRRALAAYVAVCVPVWRVQRDANGVPIGGAQKIGCVYGVRYERGQTANVLVDIPGTGQFFDSTGWPIYDPSVTEGSGGFDLEAVGAISVPMTFAAWQAAPPAWP